MFFTFNEYVSSGVPGALADAQSFISTLPLEAQSLIKVTASNQKDGYARVVVFYSDQKPEKASFDRPRITMMYSYYSSPGDEEYQYQDLYRQVLDELNRLPEHQQIFADVCFTNGKDALVEMALWF